MIIIIIIILLIFLFLFFNIQYTTPALDFLELQTQLALI